MMPLPIQFLLFVWVGWVSRQQQDVIEYLEAENRALVEQLGGRRLRFNGYAASPPRAKGEAPRKTSAS